MQDHVNLFCTFFNGSDFFTLQFLSLVFNGLYYLCSQQSPFMRLFVLFPQQEPYTMTKGSGGELEGYCIDLISELSKKLGFRYKLHLVKDNRYGAMDSSGNWNGMIGEVIRGVSHWWRRVRTYMQNGIESDILYVMSYDFIMYTFLDIQYCFFFKLQNSPIVRNLYTCQFYPPGSWSGCGLADPHCSQRAVCGHDHPLHANRHRLHPAQRRRLWRKHLQPPVALLHRHVGGSPHRIPADWSLHIPGGQVSTVQCVIVLKLKVPLWIWEMYVFSHLALRFLCTFTVEYDSKLMLYSVTQIDTKMLLDPSPSQYIAAFNQCYDSDSLEVVHTSTLCVQIWLIFQIFRYLHFTNFKII